MANVACGAFYSIAMKEMRNGRRQHQNDYPKPAEYDTIARRIIQRRIIAALNVRRQSCLTIAQGGVNPFRHGHRGKRFLEVV